MAYKYLQNYSRDYRVAKKYATCCLKLQWVLGAQRVDGGNAFHISTILLKKLNLKMSVLAWFFSSTQSSLPLIAGVSIRIRVKVKKRRNVYIYVPIKNFINKKRLSCIQVSTPVLEINLVALRWILSNLLIFLAGCGTVKTPVGILPGHNIQRPWGSNII